MARIAARAAASGRVVYQARQEFHDGQARRRTRDNLIAGIAGGLLILGVVAAQTAYFVAGPGAPEPTPTSTLDSHADHDPDAVGHRRHRRRRPHRPPDSLTARREPRESDAPPY